MKYIIPVDEGGDSAGKLQEISCGEAVRRYLLKLGCPPDRVGYKFLQESLAYVLDNDCEILSLTKDIFYECSKKFYTSVSNVDRAVRYIVEYIWKFYDENHIEELYGKNKKNGRPTNREFIYRCCEKIRSIYTHPFLQ